MRLAEVCGRYSALLEAGVSSLDIDKELLPEVEALSPSDRTKFVSLVEFARNVGIPLAQLLHAQALNATQFEQRGRELQSAFAAPRATARLVTGLPLLSLAMAELVGLNPFRALASKSLAQLAAGLGLLLLAFGWLVMRRMISKATPIDEDPGALLELFGQVLLAGLPTRAGLRLVQNHLGGDQPSAGDTLRRQIAEAERLIAFSLKSGGGLRQLVLASAELARTENFSSQRAAIDRLAIRLMIPLGLVVLPAFVLVGVVPAAIGMLGT